MPLLGHIVLITIVLPHGFVVGIHLADGHVATIYPHSSPGSPFTSFRLNLGFTTFTQRTRSLGPTFGDLELARMSAGQVRLGLVMSEAYWSLLSGRRAVRCASQSSAWSLTGGGPAWGRPNRPGGSPRRPSRGTRRRRPGSCTCRGDVPLPVVRVAGLEAPAGELADVAEVPATRGHAAPPSALLALMA